MCVWVCVLKRYLRLWRDLLFNLFARKAKAKANWSLASDGVLGFLTGFFLFRCVSAKARWTRTQKPERKKERKKMLDSRWKFSFFLSFFLSLSPPPHLTHIHPIHPKTHWSHHFYTHFSPSLRTMSCNTRFYSRKERARVTHTHKHTHYLDSYTHLTSSHSPTITQKTWEERVKGNWVRERDSRRWSRTVRQERERERWVREREEGGRGCKVRVSERCAEWGRCEANLSRGNKRSQDALSLLQVLGLLQQRDPHQVQRQREGEGEKRRQSLHSRGVRVKEPKAFAKKNWKWFFFKFLTFILSSSLKCEKYLNILKKEKIENEIEKDQKVDVWRYRR